MSRSDEDKDPANWEAMPDIGSTDFFRCANSSMFQTTGGEGKKSSHTSFLCMVNLRNDECLERTNMLKLRIINTNSLLCNGVNMWDFRHKHEWIKKYFDILVSKRHTHKKRLLNSTIYESILVYDHEWHLHRWFSFLISLFYRR